MTFAQLTGPLTARGLLAGADPRTDTARLLSRVLSEHGVARSALRGVRYLTASAVRTVEDELGRVADELLDIDLGDVVVSGWCRHSALREAALRTRAISGSEEVLVLSPHRVTATYRPRVDVFVQNRKAESFDFELNAEFDLTGVCAVVRWGRLVAVRDGECLITAMLTLEGTPLWERRAHVDLIPLVRLTPAVPLVDAYPEKPVQPRQPTTGQAPELEPVSKATEPA
jgi:hypothetical protein